MLLLLPVNVFDRNVDVVEQIRVELDRVARRHEDHYLFLHVLTQERKQKLELSRWVDNNITLFK